MFSKIGFRTPSPFELAKSSTFGDPDWWLRVKRVNGHIRVSTPCARLWLTPEDNPEDWTQPGHSEEMQLMARMILLDIPDGKYTNEQIAELDSGTLF